MVTMRTMEFPGRLWDAVGGIGRDHAIDFVKGALVVFMVVYHSMNILSTAGPDAFGYVRFVSSSFILLSGYIIARFYGGRFGANPAGTSKRLITRGLKLLLVFTVLNVLINMTGVGNPDKAQTGLSSYVENFAAIYVVGDSKRTS